MIKEILVNTFQLSSIYIMNYQSMNPNLIVLCLCMNPQHLSLFSFFTFINSLKVEMFFRFPLNFKVKVIFIWSFI